MKAAKKKTPKPAARQPKPAPYQTEDLSEEIELYSREALRFIAEANVAFGQMMHEQGTPPDGLRYRCYSSLKMAYAYGEILRDAIVPAEVQQIVRIERSVEALERAAARQATG